MLQGWIGSIFGHFRNEMVVQRVDFDGPGMNLGSILASFWGSPGSQARFWGPPLPQGWPGSVLGSILGTNGS